MSNTQRITTLEFLPNEILIHCFEYLNAFHLFHAFDQLNDRFHHLIRGVPLCINLEEDIDKSVFDRFCIKMLLNPRIKDQVHSLTLPSSEFRESENLQTKAFLSFFPLEDFRNLEKFKTNAHVKPVPIGTTSLHYSDKHILDLCIESFPKLRSLSISRLSDCSKDVEYTFLSITNLQVDICEMDDIYYFLNQAPMLRYLHINRFSCSSNLSNENTKESWLYLERLVIDEVAYSSFDSFESFMKLTPNLKSLSICDEHSNLIDAVEREHLITSLLPHLETFQFMFMCSCYEKQDMILDKFQGFETDFWEEQHRWSIEYALMSSEALIYTIPFASKIFKLRNISP